MKKLISLVTSFMMIFTLAVFLPEGAIRAGAISGTGAKASPYIVTTFDELKNILSPGDSSEHSFTKDTDIYVRLGKDISCKDLSMDNYIQTYSNSLSAVNYHLDLAGHTLYRESEYCRYLFMISSQSCLTVYDSVGNGKIETKIQPYNMHPNTFFVMGGGNLVIENGIFISNNTKTEGYVEEYIDCYGGTVTINGGTFYSYYRPIHQSSGDVIINDATFYVYGTHPERTYPGLEFNDKTSKVMIYNCTLIGVDDVVHISAPELMTDILPEKYTLIADGVEKEVTDFETYSGKPTNIYGRELIIKSPEKIDRVDVTLTEPKAGENVSNNASADDTVIISSRVRDNFTWVNALNVVTWSDGSSAIGENVVFEEGKTYTVLAKVTAKDGYQLTADTKVYINGVLAQTTATDFSGAVNYVASFVCKPARTPGDVNEDGNVNIVDVMLTQQYIVGWNVKINAANANVNGDKVVNIVDVMLMQQSIVGWKVVLV